MLFRNVAFEKGYIHYRKNENDLALAELDKANQEDAQVLELKSQLFYRLEKFQEAYELLRLVLSTFFCYNFCLEISYFLLEILYFSNFTLF